MESKSLPELLGFCVESLLFCFVIEFPAVSYCMRSLKLWINTVSKSQSSFPVRNCVLFNEIDSFIFKCGFSF